MDLNQNVKDAAYVAIGFGVIGLQRAQVVRHDVAKQVKARIENLSGRIDKVEGQIEPVLDQLTGRLPAPARTALTDARAKAKQARTTLIGRLAA